APLRGAKREELLVLGGGQAKTDHLAAPFHDGAGLPDRLDPVAIDLHGNGALEHVHRYDNAPFVPLSSGENAFQPAERASLDSNALALAKIRPGFGVKSGADDSFHCGDFAVWNGLRLLP